MEWFIWVVKGGGWANGELTIAAFVLGYGHITAGGKGEGRIGTSPRFMVVAMGGEVGGVESDVVAFQVVEGMGKGGGMEDEPAKGEGAVEVEGGLEMGIFVGIGKQGGKVVRFTACEVTRLANIAVGVDGIKDAIDAGHGREGKGWSISRSMISWRSGTIWVIHKSCG